VVVVADITNEESLENTVNWKEQVDAQAALPDGAPLPMILLSNKYDKVQELEEQGKGLEPFMTQEYLDKFASDNNFLQGLRTSAKTGHNITTAFANLVREILRKDRTLTQEEEPQPKESLKITRTNHQPKKRKKDGKCC